MGSSAPRTAPLEGPGPCALEPPKGTWLQLRVEPLHLSAMALKRVLMAMALLPSLADSSAAVLEAREALSDRASGPGGCTKHGRRGPGANALRVRG